MHLATTAVRCWAGMMVLVVTTCSCVTTTSSVTPEKKTESAYKKISDRLFLSQEWRLPTGAVTYQRHPRLAYGKGVYLLVWQDGYHGQGGKSDILGLRIDENGRRLDSKPIRICTHRAVQEMPAVSFCGGRFLVAWADLRNGKDYDLYATFVGIDGKVSAGNGFLLSGGPGAQAYPAVTSNRKDTFFAVWQDYRSGKWFEVWSTRVDAVKGTILDKDGVMAMPRGERPVVAFTGSDYVVVQKSYAARLGVNGKPSTGANQIWRTKVAAYPSVAAGWGIPFVFMNTNPTPDPWGWGGNGGIIGVTVAQDGFSPEKVEYLKKHHVRHLSRLKADGKLKNCLDAARWRSQAGWPMGRPGGFKGTRENSWPNGKTAAAYNGCSVVVAWTRAAADRYYLKNRDIYIRRVGKDWAYFDRSKIKVIAGNTDEAHPVLCAGSIGYTLLAYEKQLPEGGMVVEYRLLYEEDDDQPPKVAYIARMSDTDMILGFDEPIDPLSAAVAENYRMEGVAVQSARFNDDPRFLQREVILKTAPMKPGTSYSIKIVGVKDRSDRANITTGTPFPFVCKPGLSQRSEFIERWSLIGPFTGDRKVAYVDPTTADPTPCEKKADNKPSWQAAASKHGTVLSISKRYGEQAPASAYANTYVYSERAQDVLLRIASADGYTAWLNRKAVGEDRRKRAICDRTDEIPLELNKGWNQLMVRVDNEFGRWMLVAQFTDKERRPLPGLTYQLEKPPAF